MSNYAAKKESKDSVCTDTSNLAAKIDFISSKVEVDTVTWLMFQLVWVIWKQRQFRYWYVENSFCRFEKCSE